jgi:hypothetical protein
MPQHIKLTGALDPQPALLPPSASDCVAACPLKTKDSEPDPAVAETKKLTEADRTE